MPLRRPLLCAVALVLLPGAAHADPCPPPEPSPFHLSGLTFQGPLGATTGDTRSDECDPFALATAYTDASIDASSDVQAAHALGVQASVTATWDGTTTFGGTSGGAAELDDTFQVTGVAGPTTSVQIAVHITGDVATTGAIDPFDTEARGSFIILSDQYLPEGNGETSFLCQDNHGTAPIACHATLRGTVPVDAPIGFLASLLVNLHAASTAAHPTGSGTGAGSIALAFSITAPAGGTVERASTQYLPEADASLGGVAALGALHLSGRRGRARRRSPRSRRPACACS